eukprot:274441_1
MNSLIGILIAVINYQIYIASSQSSANCSAFHAFVQVRGAYNATLISAQALFPPHSYYIPFTPLVLLSTNDDICDPNITLSTTINNRIVLLFESIGDCTIHYKVISAQRNGARGVLMANNDDSGQVIRIADDDVLTTTIPMRSISKPDGQLLSDEIQSNHVIQVKIGCFDNITYPSLLCLSDTSGSFSFQSGEYQRQVDTQMNGHPLWKMHGYPLWRTDVYFFLHDADGDADWYWAVTEDDTFTDDSQLRLKCAVGGRHISNPSLCPLWQGTYGKGFFNFPDVNVTGRLCPIGGQQICIRSEQYALAGLDGTYTLHSNGAPQWFRDLTECDTRAATLLYVSPDQSSTGNAFFYVNDPLQSLTIAQCFLPSTQINNASMIWKPDACTPWRVRNNGLRFSELHFYQDDTLTITIGECVSKPQCVRTAVPDTFCMANNSILYGSLMGTYGRLSENGSYFNSPIYERISPLNSMDISKKALYLWYANELYAQLGFGDEYLDRRLWVLTSSSLEDAYADGSFDSYGYCQGYAFGNPLNCKGWLFEEDAIQHFDEELRLTEGTCDVDPTPSIPSEWPSYICIRLKDISIYSGALNHWSTISVLYFIGGYAIDTSTKTATHPFPQYIKTPNDLCSDSVRLQLTHEGRWESSKMNDDVIQMKCDAYYKTDSFNPVECERWYDSVNELLDNVNVYECTADDVMTISPTSAPTSPTAIPTTSAPTMDPTSAPTVSPTMLTVCLSRDDAMQSMLEGIATEVDVSGEYGTMEFIKWTVNDQVIPNLFLWYHEEKWVLSPVNHSALTPDNEVDYAPVYGYCIGGIHDNGYPVCEECWEFYWSLSRLNALNSRHLIYAPSVTDCSFELSTDVSVCDFDEIYDGDIEYVDRLCVSVAEDTRDAHTRTFASEIEVDEAVEALLGEYVRTAGELNELWMVELTSFYMHVDEENAAYIWHDRVSNYWFMGPVLGMNAVLLCRDVDGIPSECVQWNEELQSSVQVNEVYVVSMGSDDECIQNEPIIQPKKKKKESKVAGIIIGIICGMIGIACIRLLWIVYKRRNKKKRVDNMDAHAIETEICQTEAYETRTEDEAIATAEIRDQHYDMSPLNEEMDHLDVDDTNDPLTTDADDDDNEAP